jgi:predicted transcriptional regulator
MAAVTETTQIAARVPVDLVLKLNELAERNERSASAELRIALKAHIEADEAIQAASAQ